MPDADAVFGDALDEATERLQAGDVDGFHLVTLHEDWHVEFSAPAYGVVDPAIDEHWRTRAMAGVHIDGYPVGRAELLMLLGAVESVARDRGCTVDDVLDAIQGLKQFAEATKSNGGD